jgi:hypothetical protein
VEGIQLPIRAADLKRGKEHWKGVQADRDWIELFVVGTVDYYDALGGRRNRRVGEAHQTGFIVQIFRAVPIGNLYEIGPSLSDIAADHLDVRRWYQDGRVDRVNGCDRR